MMDELKQAMKQAFANSYAFYLKAHYFHWNVEGMFFSQFHDFFGNVYQEVYNSIDPFAENIRKLGSYAPGSFSRLSQLAEINDEERIPPAKDMLEILLRDNDIILQSIKTAYDAAESVGAHGLSNFLAERQDAHMKHAWMLRATLK
jgi:starvation-inducible DNA-binding protein